MPGWAVTSTTASASSTAVVERDALQAKLGERGDVGVVVVDDPATLLEDLHDPQRRGFADVADAALVAGAEDQDLRSVDGLGDVVERALDPLDAVVGHLLVDLAGELDELGGHVELARAPGQVERIDGQAVAAHPRTGLEAHEPVGLGRGGVDDLPDVDPHPLGEDRQLVDERDVDRAEDVLQQLGHLRDLGRRDRARRGRTRADRARPPARCTQA